jgi:hypothetical protein
MRGYRVLTSAEYTTIMIVELAVHVVWDPLSIRWFGWESDGSGLDFLTICAFVIF